MSAVTGHGPHDIGGTDWSIERLRAENAELRAHLQAVRDLCTNAHPEFDVFQGALVVQVDDVLAAIGEQP